MSAEAATARHPDTWSLPAWRANPSTARTFRYALGSTLAMALALGIDWQLSYLTPVLALNLLGTPAPRPTLGGMVRLVGIVTIASLAGVLVSAALLPYPAVALLLIGLGLFLLFYASGRGANPALVTLLLIAITVIPVVALLNGALAAAVAKGLVAGAAGAIVVVWLAHVLVPEPAPRTDVPVPTSIPPPTPSRQAALSRAAMSTALVFPMVATFLAFSLGSVLVLVFVAVLSMQPDFSKSFQAGKALIWGNVFGGLVSILFYELLVMVPLFPFLLILTLLTGLWFGRRLFSDRKASPLFGMAYSTVILVIASTTSMYGEAEAKAWGRVLQITIAVVYLVVGSGVLTRLMRKRRVTHATG